MNVLGVVFDNRLQWTDQVAHTINKANSALHCIGLIKHYFKPEELCQIITSLWSILTLNHELKTRLLSISASALKICTPSYHDRMSYIDLHKINKRATPMEFCYYKHALLSYNLVHNELPIEDWVDLNFQQILGSRSKNFNFVRTNNYRVGVTSSATD